MKLKKQIKKDGKDYKATMLAFKNKTTKVVKNIKSAINKEAKKDKKTLKAWKKGGKKFDHAIKKAIKAHIKKFYNGKNKSCTGKKCSKKVDESLLNSLGKVMQKAGEDEWTVISSVTTTTTPPSIDSSPAFLSFTKSSPADGTCSGLSNSIKSLKQKMEFAKCEATKSTARRLNADKAACSKMNTDLEAFIAAFQKEKQTWDSKLKEIQTQISKIDGCKSKARRLQGKVTPADNKAACDQALAKEATAQKNVKSCKSADLGRLLGVVALLALAMFV